MDKRCRNPECSSGWIPRDDGAVDPCRECQPNWVPPEVRSRTKLEEARRRKSQEEAERKAGLREEVKAPDIYKIHT